MASGCPVITTNKGGNKEQIVHGNNGFLCESIEEFEKSLEFYINNEEMIKKMGNNSIMYSKEFSSEKIIHKLMDFIQ